MLKHNGSTLACVLAAALAAALAGCAKEPTEEGSVDTTLDNSDEEQAQQQASPSPQPAEDAASARNKAEAAARKAYEDAEAAADDLEYEASAPRPEPRDPVPRGYPGSWATTNDYPSAALRESREGTAAFRLVVNEGGRVADCQIVASSGHADLDQVTCENIRRRARFSPDRKSVV